MGETPIQTTIRLLREARGGRERAIDDLFARYLPKVRRIVSLRLGYPIRDFALYEDLVQDSLLRAFEKLESFEELSDGTFQNWIATCVASSVNLHFRKAGAEKRGGGNVKALGELGSEGLSASIFRGREPGPSSVASAREIEDALEEALLSLKSHHREIIILRHLCGMSSREIAAAMGFSSAATVRKVLSRAMSELKNRMPRDLFSSGEVPS
ncbi:MAG: sigma-70 family RNA polymerase sigma factor [Planctomycetes bacterium]|nr:sigma-70 family RNA polymerase sigma factor [Planctomycetota bacterium]